MSEVRRLLRADAELMMVVLFWAFNVTVVKLCLREMAPLAFNILRFGLATVTLLALTAWLDGPLRISRSDQGRMLLLGIVGHTLYQLCFVEGLARTTASSTSLIFGSTPVVVAVLSRLAGHERISGAGAAGILMAFLGCYVIVRDTGRAAGPGSAPGESQLIGNLLMVAAVLCWSGYTVLSRGLLTRHSPLRVTAVSLSIGTALLLPASLADLRAQQWGRVSAASWAGLVYSFAFALVISYVVWYRSVSSVGSVRTAVYSNLVPVFGTLFGVWLLGERLTASLGLGGGCILGGIVLTRLSELAGGRLEAAPPSGASR